MTASLLALCLPFMPLALEEVAETEFIRQEISTTSHTLQLENINGNLEIEGYDGDVVVLEVEKIISADDAVDVKKGMEEVQLGKEDRNDTLEIFMDVPWQQKEVQEVKKEGKLRIGKINGWTRANGWHWNPPYDFTLHFRLKVPRDMNLCVSTINRGQVNISGVRGDIAAENINGSIELSEVRNPSWAKTINGQVTVVYDQIPRQEASFATLNGDVRVEVPSGLEAQVMPFSRHGDVYTNLPEMAVKRIQQQRKEERDGETHYQLSNQTALVVRNGQFSLRMETMNGDIWIEER
ncbi:MAG: hypothetical protein AAF399_06960 [Bacteroidota bacterium]